MSTFDPNLFAVLARLTFTMADIEAATGIPINGMKNYVRHGIVNPLAPADPSATPSGASFTLCAVYQAAVVNELAAAYVKPSGGSLFASELRRFFIERPGDWRHGVQGRESAEYLLIRSQDTPSGRHLAPELVEADASFVLDDDSKGNVVIFVRLRELLNRIDDALAARLAAREGRRHD